MLSLTLPGEEYWDNEKEEFVYPDSMSVKLEHSLVSLSKWEAIHEKTFLTEVEKTQEEILSYIKCMAVDDFPPEAFSRLTDEHLEIVQSYITSKQTATWFPDDKKSGASRERITSELIYYWMTSMEIPWEAQYWHLNRLFALLRVFSAKNTKQQPRSPAEIAKERARLNAERLQKWNTTG